MKYFWFVQAMAKLDGARVCEWWAGCAERDVIDFA